MTEQTELWKLVRDWLRKQKHISRRVVLEVIEYGPPFAQLCTIGNGYTYAYIYADHVSFVSYLRTEDDSALSRTDIILTLRAHDKEFFKKMKEQLWSMLRQGNVNWPPHNNVW